MIQKLVNEQLKKINTVVDQLPHRSHINRIPVQKDQNKHKQIIKMVRKKGHTCTKFTRQ